MVTTWTDNIISHFTRLHSNFPSPDNKKKTSKALDRFHVPCLFFPYQHPVVLHLFPGKNIYLIIIQFEKGYIQSNKLPLLRDEFLLPWQRFLRPFIDRHFFVFTKYFTSFSVSLDCNVILWNFLPHTCTCYKTATTRKKWTQTGNAWDLGNKNSRVVLNKPFLPFWFRVRLIIISQPVAGRSRFLKTAKEQKRNRSNHSLMNY